jgi:AmpD protein
MMRASDHEARFGVPAFEVDAAHRLRGALWLPSPHVDQRPDAADISLLVVHAISLPPGQTGALHNKACIDALFLGSLDPQAHPYFETIKDLHVSAHLCVFRDGEVHQYASFERRAWHAGESGFDGRRRCNDFSIGVELEGCEEQPFSDAQYAALARIAAALMRAYPGITPERIAGHSDIAPGRKTDPGPHFDWTRLICMLEHPR